MERRQQGLAVGRPPVAFTPTGAQEPPLAYLLGVIKGDGSLNHSMQCVVLKVVDQPFAERFAEAARMVGLAPNGPRTIASAWGPVWAVTIRRRRFYEWVREADWQGLAQRYPREFLCGFYESEGTCPQGRLMMANTRPDLVDQVTALLVARGFHPSVRWYRVDANPAHRPVAHIRLPAWERAAFLAWVDPCIKRGEPRPRRVRLERRA